MATDLGPGSMSPVPIRARCRRWTPWGSRSGQSAPNRAGPRPHRFFRRLCAAGGVETPDSGADRPFAQAFRDPLRHGRRSAMRVQDFHGRPQAPNRRDRVVERRPAAGRGGRNPAHGPQQVVRRRLRALAWYAPCVYLTSYRRGGRVAEGAGLLNQYTGNRIEGSNPSLSANSLPLTPCANQSLIAIAFV